MRRPSPALVVAVIALVAATGGTSYAVAQLPRNSVGTAQLKRNAVTSVKIRDGAIQSADLSAAARTALKGERGPAGATGPQGPAGPGRAGSAVSSSLALIPGASGALGATLGTTPTATSTGPVTVTQASRLQISASAQVYKEVTTQVYLECSILYRAVSSSNWLDTTLPSTRSTTLPAKIPAGRVFAVVALEVSQAVDPGSYNVGVACRGTKTAEWGIGDAYLSQSSLNVVAVPTGG